MSAQRRSLPCPSCGMPVALRAGIIQRCAMCGVMLVRVVRYGRPRLIRPIARFGR